MTDTKNIQTIAPLLAGDFVDLNEPIFDADKYSEFLENNAIRLGAFKKYLICKLHDSRVIDTKHDNGSFKITLNDISTYVFADTLIEKFNLPIDSNHISFPLSIELAENLKVEFNKVDDDGNLIPIDPIKVDEYLYEQVTHLDHGKVEIVFHLWKSNLKDDKPGERIIIIVSAKDITVTENQDEAWQHIFGAKYNSHYHYFKEQFDNERYVSDRNECEKLIAEFEQNQMTNERKSNA